jgi:beta-lactamase class D
MPLTHRIPFTLASLIILSVAAVTSTAATDRTVRPELEKIFSDKGVIGTFVLFDVSEDRLHLVNPNRAERRFFPASTFKVANSLIALEAGVVADENEVIPYGGKPQPVKSWESDMSMRQAIKVSNVPVYQELARRIGLENYGKWLERIGYGNQQTGGNVENFWLVGPLAISAIEQIGFLTKLTRSELPAATESQAVVRNILRLEKCNDSVFYGKSGWSTAPNPQIAWLVGWIERDDQAFVFALNIDVTTRSEANLREPLARALLSEFGVWRGC